MQQAMVKEAPSSTAMQLEEAPGARDWHFANAEWAKRFHRPSLCRSAVLNEPIASTDREQEIMDVALAAMARESVDFGDLRLGRDMSRFVETRDSRIAHHDSRVSEGLGVRVVCDGAWGFAASPDLSDEGVERVVRRAALLARASHAASARKRSRADFLRLWAKEPPRRAEHHTPIVLCPFAASVDELADGLCRAAECHGEAAIKRVQGNLVAYGRRRWFASSEGARILTTHAVVDAAVRFYAVENQRAAYRTLMSPGMVGGYEHYVEADFPRHAPQAALEARLKCRAEPPASGNYTLILDGHNLALTMHESVGHPTELDRVLWLEWGMAGGSFAGLDKRGHFQYGSDIVNFTANNRLRFGGASVGYDDEGVECQKFPVIEAGVLVGYGSNRESAHTIEASRANGTCRATTWADVPIVRIPNLYLEPGRERLGLDELIADTKDGIYLLGRDSFSIDQMRYNFQFGADMAWRIRDGKLAEPLRDVIYQSISPEFWRSCDAICDKREWQMHGVVNCGKGQPMQLARMTHGAAPARFRNVKVGY